MSNASFSSSKWPLEFAELIFNKIQFYWPIYIEKLKAISLKFFWIRTQFGWYIQTKMWEFKILQILAPLVGESSDLTRIKSLPESVNPL